MGKVLSLSFEFLQHQEGVWLSDNINLWRDGCVVVIASGLLSEIRQASRRAVLFPYRKNFIPHYPSPPRCINGGLLLPADSYITPNKYVGLHIYQSGEVK